MRAVIQRVTQASVKVDSKICGEIREGILVFAGISIRDTDSDIAYITDKLLNMRIFTDDQGKMNRSLTEYGYEILVVSQFTLYGDVRKGRRPSFTESRSPVEALIMYNKLIDSLKTSYAENKIQTGVFQADMKIELVNDGPVTILLDSERKF